MQPPTQQQNQPPNMYFAEASGTPSPRKTKCIVEEDDNLRATGLSTDDVLSYVTQSGLSTSPCTQKGSVTKIQMESNSQNKTEAITRTNILVPPPTGPCVFNVSFHDGTHGGRLSFESHLIASKFRLVLCRTHNWHRRVHSIRAQVRTS